ncbi:MAG: hypothetical protein N2043_02265 [Ignavibacterium sp.]|nr:hypothetical protein [Ignavibacterium sp.]
MSGVRNSKTEYWVFVRPLHKAYGKPVKKTQKQIPEVPHDYVKHLFYRKKKHCYTSGCPFEVYAVDEEVFCLFEVCYSIEEAKKSFKKALKTWAKEDIKIIQRISPEYIMRN